ncbi:NmrA family transcriptional regulator [Pseudoalteromonas sp. A25]|uniref:NAD(P)-dependent oxidoreductase n=1 Tax=Pseudoalteromonas sp. A25 TaxID=116092 RepID=UPI0012611FEC|nr:NAD(P)-binding oxidoreductase [Pseudoalteromonas sp. A25]BBN80337.1 NmrA family transcriptional regulator [Pseudoalteromonas sp. A25]
MREVNNVVVIGATGGSGYNTVQALVKLGYTVTAMSRNASKTFKSPIKAVDGSALDEAPLRVAIAGQDAVIITLGISQNPIGVRLFGAQKTPLNIRSQGTKKVIQVMKSLGVKRLIVQTTYGSGPSKNKLRLLDKLFFDWILKPQVDDTELQDSYVRESQLDWTIVQPVHLTDDDNYHERLFSSSNYEVGQWSVSRTLVGKFNALLVNDNATINETYTLSALPET